MTAGDAPSPDQTPDAATPRRDFLTLTTASTCALGAACLAWPALDGLLPPERAGTDAPLDVDLAPIVPGRQIVLRWRDLPIFILRRTEAQLAHLRAPLPATLRDPDSTTPQQPDYARNWHRSLVPEIGVYIGVCTHLGCVPQLQDAADELYLCPCHGSRFDLAARVKTGSPAQLNLPVPPHRVLGDTLRLGENPAGARFFLSDIRQL